MARTRFRWRTIPAGFFTLFGGLLLLLSGSSQILLLLGVQRSVTPISTWHQSCGLLLMALCGGTWMFAGRCWWRGQWTAGVVSTAIGYGLGVLGTSQAWML